MAKETFVYDYQKEPEFSFRKWFLIRIMTVSPDNMVEKLEGPTDHFQNVEVDITINGITVDAEQFLDSMEQTFQAETEFEAKKMIRSSIPSLELLNEAVYDMQRDMKAQLRRKIRELGFELDPEDD